MIKKGNTVQIITGNDKGKQGKVLKVLKKENKVLVEGMNMKKETKKADKQNTKGSIVSVSHPIHISNVKEIK